MQADHHLGKLTALLTQFATKNMPKRDLIALCNENQPIPMRILHGVIENTLFNPAHFILTEKIEALNKATTGNTMMEISLF